MDVAAREWTREIFKEERTMTDKEREELKKKLWKTADDLRQGAGLKASQYAQPVFGLIFLRFAENKYRKVEPQILAEFNAKKGKLNETPIEKIAMKQCGFYLPAKSRYEYILKQPSGAGLAKVIHDAMEEVEKYNEDLVGVLPKNVYFEIAKSKDDLLLEKLVKNFQDIPDNVEIDIFGEIYEYFLGEFSLKEGQGGGEFYTPVSVVQYMVKVLRPTGGKILDPACGSGGMFVQAARYMHAHNDVNLSVSGVEKDAETVKLAKMNLALNNVKGVIKNANTFYEDPFSCFGKFDYVMANPPFNVDGVDYARVQNETRFNTYGIPRNKSKAKKGTGETVPNANYLWINLFATALKAGGRAGLVMPCGAESAGDSELEIRKRLISAGIIKQMTVLPSNMFNTVVLPAMLWFFDKAKMLTDKKDEVLFVDARKIYTQVDTTHRKFTEEQQRCLALITRLYEGDTAAYGKLKLHLETLRAAAIADKAAQLATEEKAFAAAKAKIGEGKSVEKKLAKAAEKHEKIVAEITKTSDAEITRIERHLAWMAECFPEGVYRDVTGLCRVGKITGEGGIEENGWSLNPGRYVGVVQEVDTTTPAQFRAEMKAMHDEFAALTDEAHKIEKRIAANLQEVLG
ncbi:MAG: N-6 DNA methylase [Kiritimatiellia bacterium]